MLTQKGNLKPFLLYKITFFLFFLFFTIGFTSNSWPIFFQMLPIYLSLIFLGLSHGAADHLCMWGLLSNKTIKAKIGLIILYFLVAILYLFLWLKDPVLSIILFFMLTIFHWGKADLYTACFLNNTEYLKHNRWIRFSYVCFRGSAPILLPIAFNQKVYLDFLNSLTFRKMEIFNFEQYIHFNLIFIPIAFFLFSVIIFLFFEKDKIRNYNIIIWDFFESILLIIWFLYMPVLWAIGIYFIFWHSLRHALRILSSDTQGFRHIINFSLKKLSIRWIEITGLINLIALIGMFIIFNTQIFNINNDYNFFSNIMIGISIVTLPHVILVEITDIKLNRKHLID